MPLPELAWYACDLVTGEILDELPLTSSSPVKQTLAAVDTDTVQLPLSDRNCPDDWHTLLVPGKTMIVLTVDDHPVQGWVYDRSPGIGGPVIDLSLQTLYVALEETNVRTLEAADLDAADALYRLLTAPDPDRVNDVGFAAEFGFTVAWEPCGQPCDRDYTSTEDLTLLAAANERNAAPQGPEYRITLAWTDADQTGFDKLITIGPTAGVTRDHVIFDRDSLGRGTIESYRRPVRRGALRVTGVTDGSGSERLMTAPQTSDLVAAGWAPFEERRPFTGIDDEQVLAELTATYLEVQEHGATSWELIITADAPQPGRDYDLGDFVGVQIAAHEWDPVGANAWLKVRGTELDPVNGTVKLIAWDPVELLLERLADATAGRTT